MLDPAATVGTAIVLQKSHCRLAGLQAMQGMQVLHRQEMGMRQHPQQANSLLWVRCSKCHERKLHLTAEGCMLGYYDMWQQLHVGVCLDEHRQHE
jgi:hypothetical protein